MEYAVVDTSKKKRKSDKQQNVHKVIYVDATYLAT